MTLLQLLYFDTLARVLHYTRAAQELHISQPSLSYAINELEKELDVQLFVREKRHITLIIGFQNFLCCMSTSNFLFTDSNFFGSYFSCHYYLSFAFFTRNLLTIPFR